MKDLFGCEAETVTGFDEFWLNTPKTGSKFKAGQKFNTFSAQVRKAAHENVKAYYAWWKSAHPNASPLHVTTYLNQRRWEDDDWKPKAAPTAIDKQQATIDNIKSGQRWRCTNITATQARDLISKELVTETECKKAGVL